MLVKPDFFDEFQCKASACMHTCCAGWEIDVDEDTADWYASLEGEDGEFVRGRLITGKEGCKLCLEGERCRFLREDGLCEMILRLGEGALCEICAEHPRFYSGEGGVTLAGHGLACEEAARLWLEKTPEFVFEEDGEEAEDFAKEALSLLMEKLSRAAEILPASIGREEYKALRELFVSLEAMDPAYPARYSITPPELLSPELTNLVAYFLYRYWFEYGEVLAVKFAAASVIMIAALGGETSDAARLYSCEVEYDPDNTARIIEFLAGSELFTK